MPRPRSHNPCKPIGVSFYHLDLCWLKMTYGDLPVSDLVRCSIMDAKFWRTMQNSAPTDKPVEASVMPEAADGA